MTDPVIPDAAVQVATQIIRQGGDPLERIVRAALTAALPHMVADQNAEIERLRDLFRRDIESHEAFTKSLTERHEARITKYVEVFTAKDAENAELKAEPTDAQIREIVDVWFENQDKPFLARMRVALSVLKKFAT